VTGPTVRVVLTTHGRFHSFDLAEQLQRAGWLSAIYTPYPRFKLHNTRVDPRRIRSFPYVSALHRLVEGRRAPLLLQQLLQLQAGKAIDAYARATLSPCDILMALSGSGLSSGRAVRRSGGRYVCDRGSTHLRHQMRVLAEEYDRVGIPFRPVHPRLIEREEAEYREADAITVPSRFAASSFAAYGIDMAKVAVVPFGVDLEHFSPRVPRDPAFRVLFVGQLSVRKGIGYLAKAFRIAALPGAKLVFVGSTTGETKTLLGDNPPAHVEFTGPLSRDEVAAQMSRASVLVLPSIEEGLAMVQAQALACGCPVIATTNSGAEDLFDNGREGFIVPARDPEAIAHALTLLYQDRDLLHAMTQAARSRVEQIGGWDRYGAEIMALFSRLLDSEPVGDGRVS
jgi:glycosyltransferase involved in cell wall biosynthesis